MSHYKKSLLGACLLALLATASARADDEALVALELEQVQALAVTHQPLLEAGAAAVRAARERSIAAGQLPDPQLNFEVRDVPANGPDRYSFTRDSDTQFMLGVMQEFPPGDTRRLRSERVRLEGDASEQELNDARLLVRRDAALAWVDVWMAEEASKLLGATEREIQLQRDAAQIAYATGTASQAELLEARVELSLVQERIAGVRQQAAHYRNNLSRWILDAAYRPLCPELPAWPAPPPTQAVLDRLRDHPHLGSESARAQAAAADVAIARQAYKPGWRAGLGYGYRPEFPEMLSVQVGIDLPLFTAKRQDRNLAAKLAQQEQAEQMRDDRLRQHTADVRLNRADWDLLQKRLQRYDDDILPQSEQRTAAALAAWQSGRSTLGTVLAARRMALDLRLQRLDLQADTARHYLKLEYLTGVLP